MYYCYNIEACLFDNEKEYAKEIGVYLFYDEMQDVFVDKDNNIIDIENKVCFIRTGVYEEDDLMNAVIRHKGKLLTSKDDSIKVLNWPNYLKTKRKATIFSGQEIIDNLDKIVKTYGNKNLFFKTKDKNYSQIIDVSVLCDKTSSLYKALEIHAKEDFIISEDVNIIENECGPFEYRCFIVNNKILNISRVNDYLLEQIPDDIINKANEIIDKLKNSDFPDCYVLDLFLYEDKNHNQILDILECNSIESSGTYLYNSVFIDNYDIKYTNPRESIPKEKIMYEDTSKFSYNAEYGW